MHTQLANAKINLALHVTGQRQDGYHLLDSLIGFTHFGDELSFQSADRFSLSIEGPFAPMIPKGTDNLIIRAADKLRQHALKHGHDFGTSPLSDSMATQTQQGAHITLYKNLPPASGIGGGSADAAATLRGLCHLWHYAPCPKELSALALELGADVPMCLLNSPCRAQGIGELLTPLEMPSLPLVLLNAGTPVATPAIFKALTMRQNAPLPKKLSFTTLDDMVQNLADFRNDLQSPALKTLPLIQKCLDHLQETGAKLVRMSGSGATCFGLYQSQEEAKEASQQIKARHPNWWCIATKTKAYRTKDAQHEPHR